VEAEELEEVRVESGTSDTQGRMAAIADADADSSDLENKKGIKTETRKSWPSRPGHYR